MGVSANELKTNFPEFASETNKRINFFIGMAERRISREHFGDKADDAVCLMAAHLLTMADRAGAGGAITGEKVGDLSTNYASQSSKDGKGSLNATSYGQMYSDLEKSCRLGPRVLGCRNH